MRYVLYSMSLYDLVSRPVIKGLNELNVPEQSRVWWCPTSVFCPLPLHAIGPIPSGVGPPRYFLNLYIPSYTPSLSTLMESRKPDSQAIDSVVRCLIHLDWLVAAWLVPIIDVYAVWSRGLLDYKPESRGKGFSIQQEGHAGNLFER